MSFNVLSCISAHSVKPELLLQSAFKAYQFQWPWGITVRAFLLSVTLNKLKGVGISLGGLKAPLQDRTFLNSIRLD